MKKILTNSQVRTYLNKYHNYHLISPSVWPLCVSLAIFSIVLSMISYFAFGCMGVKSGCFLFDFCDTQVFIGIAVLVLFLYFWWNDVSLESGQHTDEVMGGIKIGMCLFIVSEVMFFFFIFLEFFSL